VVTGLLDDFASRHPTAVIEHAGEVFVAAESAPDLVAEARQRGIGVLGLEGFLIDGDYVYPALSRIADFSRQHHPSEPDFVEWSTTEALKILAGPWSSRPAVEDQMHPDAAGRHMIAIVLDESTHEDVND
jgi:hypothetical protein